MFHIFLDYLVLLDLFHLSYYNKLCCDKDFSNTTSINELNEYFRNYLENISIRIKSHGWTHQLFQISIFSGFQISPFNLRFARLFFIASVITIIITTIIIILFKHCIIKDVFVLALFSNKFIAWKVSKSGVFSGPYVPAFILNTERYKVSLRIQSECGEIRTRKNSVFGHFSRSGFSSFSFIMSFHVTLSLLTLFIFQYPL